MYIIIIIIIIIIKGTWAVTVNKKKVLLLTLCIFWSYCNTYWNSWRMLHTHACKHANMHTHTQTHTHTLWHTQGVQRSSPEFYNRTQNTIHHDHHHLCCDNCDAQTHVSVWLIVHFYTVLFFALDHAVCACHICSGTGLRPPTLLIRADNSAGLRLSYSPRKMGKARAM